MDNLNLQSDYEAIEIEVNDYYDYFEISNFFKNVRDKFEKVGLLKEARTAEIEINTFGFRINRGSLVPFAQMPNDLGVLIEIPSLTNFHESDYIYLKKRYNESKHPMLKARYSHVLWEGSQKQYKCAKKSIEAYFDLIRIFEEKDSINPHNSFITSIISYIYVICKLSCSIKADTENIRREVFRLLNNFNPKSESVFILKFNLIQTILDFPKIFSQTDLLILPDFCLILGKELTEQKIFRLAIRFYELGERIDHKLKNHNNIWRLNIAEIYELMMNSASSKEIASTFCLQAIEEYQKLKINNKIDELSKILATIKMDFSFKEFSHEIDLSDHIKMCKKVGIQVIQHDPCDILEFLLSEKSLIPRLDIVKQRAKEIDQIYVFTKAVPTTLIDRHGNPIQIFSTDDQKAHYSILQQYKLELEINKQFLINEIILDVVREGKLNSNFIIEYLNCVSWIGHDIKYVLPNQKIISCNLLETVKPSLEIFFYEMRLFVTFPGYHPNFTLFIDSFTLKIEGIFREFCKQINIPTFTPKREGIIYEKILEDLLREDPLKFYYYEDEIFFFKFILTEKGGYNIRNQIAHNLMIPSEYSIDYAFDLMIVFLKLCNVREIRGCYSRWDA